VTELFNQGPSRKGIGGHHSPASRTDVWLTPKFIIDALGPFDLDPCAAPEPRPWPTAAEHWGPGDNSLQRAWRGRVWLNPPYGGPKIVGPWMHRIAEHGQGTALIFARTETDVFFKTVWRAATSLLFLYGRLTFFTAAGVSARDEGGGNAGAPSVLVAYGHADAGRLASCGIEGHYVSLR
jgi:DNA N-6-adenine-methyltransferase (Dam)